jgi:hypothetical protein
MALFYIISFFYKVDEGAESIDDDSSNDSDRDPASEEVRFS